MSASIRTLLLRTLLLMAAMGYLLSAIHEIKHAVSSDHHNCPICIVKNQTTPTTPDLSVVNDDTLILVIPEYPFTATRHSDLPDHRYNIRAPPLT